MIKSKFKLLIPKKQVFGLFLISSTCYLLNSCQLAPIKKSKVNERIRRNIKTDDIKGILHNDYLKLQGKDDKALSLDIARCGEFSINGKIIPKEEPEKMLDSVKKELTPEQFQLASFYATQIITSGSAIRMEIEIIDEFGPISSSNNSAVQVTTLPDENLEITYQSTKKYDDSKDINPKGLKSSHIEVKGIVSRDKEPELKSSYYTIS
ncbi:MAG: hypothetical protein C4617_02715 [Candidatus Liberibacter europaeus]|uniref:Uncharacterized protein n=1 Tax=Candidatus Liberibacter europaeus TaxID=744859 RepID=A0A2T4VY85_9HYPH|nr:hypothetical protein [Candidatus Liberibacter europaeus]PTL86738.1 MAG: hypothetical protein C4617_02715 [Candidatus Liberibacter europaeus]